MAGSGVKLTGDTDPLRGLSAALRQLASLTADVGYLDADPVPDSPGLTVPTLAAIHEFGTDTIPARPFMTRAAAAARPMLDSLAKREIAEVVDSGEAAVQAMAEAAGSLARAIVLELETTEQWAVPITAETFNRNGGVSAPLHGRHGTLLAGVRYEIQREGSTVARGNSHGE